MRQLTGKVWTLPCIALVVLLTGCASTQSTDPSDPYESMNRSFYGFNDALDRHFFKPVAQGYVDVTPDPVRTGVTNFFDNVGYLDTMANDLLQGKAGQFLQDTGRFIINSTLGIGGLFDPATSMGLKEHDEDLGQTFGVWGAGEGAYLTLPLFGPSSFRDAPGLATAMLLNPLTYLNPVVTFPLQFVNAVNTRANYLEATRIRDEAALDPYIFVREAYRQQREFKIYDGNPPGDDFDEYFEGEGESAILRVY
jgi:phospholipid-binding lipoprotein MlaA